MPTTALHIHLNTDALSAADVRFALALCGYEAGAVRVRAVTNKLRDLGFDGAMRWASTRTAEQVGRDIRAVWAGLYIEPHYLRRRIELCLTSRFPEVAFDAHDQLRVHDAAAARLAAMQMAEAA